MSYIDQIQSGAIPPLPSNIPAYQAPFWDIYTQTRASNQQSTTDFQNLLSDFDDAFDNFQVDTASDFNDLDYRSNWESLCYAPFPEDLPQEKASFWLIYGQNHRSDASLEHFNELLEGFKNNNPTFDDQYTSNYWQSNFKQHIDYYLRLDGVSSPLDNNTVSQASIQGYLQNLYLNKINKTLATALQDIRSKANNNQEGLDLVSGVTTLFNDKELKIGFNWVRKIRPPQGDIKWDSGDWLHDCDRFNQCQSLKVSWPTSEKAFLDLIANYENTSKGAGDTYLVPAGVDWKMQGFELTDELRINWLPDSVGPRIFVSQWGKDLQGLWYDISPLGDNATTFPIPQESGEGIGSKLGSKYISPVYWQGRQVYFGDNPTETKTIGSEDFSMTDFFNRVEEHGLNNIHFVYDTTTRKSNEFEQYPPPFAYADSTNLESTTTTQTFTDLEYSRDNLKKWGFTIKDSDPIKQVTSKLEDTLTQREVENFEALGLTGITTDTQKYEVLNKLKTKLQDLEESLSPTSDIKDQIQAVLNSMPKEQDFKAWSSWQKEDNNSQILQDAAASLSNFNSVLSATFRKQLFVMDEFYRSASDFATAINNILRSTAQRIKR
ncbi:MAG: hypothetical protein ACQEP8_00405 [Chlamydiota bacterium]